MEVKFSVAEGPYEKFPIVPGQISESEYGCDADGDARFWITAERRRVPISKLGNDHIVNILRLFERGDLGQFSHAQALETAANALATLQGEMALYYAEQDFDRIASGDYDPCPEDDFRYRALVKEAQRRKLTWHEDTDG